jgi:epoxide hydrolase
MRELCDDWVSGFDWRAQEAAINAIPQFTTEIDGQRIHFFHVRSATSDALPLILTHGWPGSVLEFLDVIGPLSKDFHLVIPSIPGFGLSGPTHEKGWDQVRVARAWAELMHRLGYERYGAQGGDWGSGISRALGGIAPERVVGVHITYLPTPPAPDGAVELSAEDHERAERTKRFAAARPGYQVLQATRPQTISYALTDSPVGQLAWIAEKFTEWTDPRSAISADQILADVSLYWLTATAGSSARLTKETGIGGRVDCPVPVGMVVLPYDILLSVRPLAERMYDIVHWTEFERGGHFAALEVPDLFVSDVRAFFEKLA